MLGHELFEADEEAGFEGDEALDRCRAAALLVTDPYESVSRRLVHSLRWGRCPGIPEDVDNAGEEIGYHSDEQQELAKLFASPCPFQVSSSEPDHHPADGEGNQIVFHQSGCEKGPRELVGGGGEEDEVGYGKLARPDIIDCFCCAGSRSQGGRPLAETKGGVQRGDGEQEEEEAAGQRRQVDAHGWRRISL